METKGRQARTKRTPLVARRHRVLQHLPYRLSRKSKLPGYRSLTPALNTNRTPHTSVYLHLEHPSGVL